MTKERNLNLQLNKSENQIKPKVQLPHLKRRGDWYKKVSVGAGMMFIAFTVSALPCFASTTAVSIPTEIVQSMIDVILLVFRIIGVLMAVYSIGALVMAFKNEDPDAKTKNASMMVVSLVLIFLKTLVDATGIASYISGI